MILCSPDPTSVCPHLDRTGGPARTPSHLALRPTSPLLCTGLHCRLTVIPACPLRDPWGRSLDRDRPTDTPSSPGPVRDTPWTSGVRHSLTSVPLRLITLDRCLHHTMPVGPWDHVPPSLLTPVTTAAPTWTCLRGRRPTLPTAVPARICTPSRRHLRTQQGQPWSSLKLRPLPLPNPNLSQ